MHPNVTHPALVAEHARLGAMVGTWDVQMTFWSKPGEPPIKSRGFAVVEALFGGLFIQERVEGLIGEVPFVTMSWTGFNPQARRYEATRIASTRAHRATETGDFDERQGALVLEGDGGAAGSRVRTVLKQRAPDQLLLECFEVPTSGAPWKSCEISYTRRKGYSGSGDP